MLRFKRNRRQLPSHVQRKGVGVERGELELFLRIEARKTEQLLDEPGELFDLERNIAELLRRKTRLKPCPQRRKRGTQLVRGVGRKVLLNAIVRFEPILEGLPLQEVLSTVADLHLNTATIAALLGVRPRTIARWRRTSNKTLAPVHGSRIYRLMRILQDGVAIFGSSQATIDWLQKNQQALAFSRPLELMTPDAGVTCVLELLARIRCNVYT